MKIKLFRKSALAPALLFILCGWIAACASQRSLVVPTTPPSEDRENPGPDALPESPKDPSTSRGACGSAEDCFDAALESAENGDAASASDGLRRLAGQYPESVWAKRTGFLLGKWAAETGSPEADALLSRAMTDLPDLSEYGLFFIAEGQAKGGRLSEAVQTYDGLLNRYPDSVLNARAVYQKAQALLQMGDCPAALTELDGFVACFPQEEAAAGALLQISDCAQKSRDAARAVSALQRIRYYYADRSEAARAQSDLQRLSDAGISIPEPAFEARIQRARTLMEAARYEEAVSEWKALLALGEPGNHDEIRLKLGDALIQLKRYDEANDLLEAVAGRTSRPDLLTASLFWLGRIAARQGDEERLIRIEKRLAERFPDSPERAKLLFFIGNFHEDRQRTEQAVRVYEQVIAEAPSDPSAEDAVWRIGWIAYRAGRYDDAVRFFEEYLAGHSGSSLGGQFGYWIGRSAEQAGRPLKAAEAYREVCRKFLRTFYCQQASTRLSRLEARAVEDGGPSPRPDSASPLVPPVGEAAAAWTRDRHYPIALELMTLRLRSEALPELSFLTERYATNRSNVLKLAELLYAADDYYHSLRLLRLYFQDVLEKGGNNVPSSFWEKAYPRRFVERIQKQTPAVATDPFLVAAVIREESGFDSKAVSKAGALGLMQLMPYTAEWVARRAGLSDFQPERLLDEEINIRLGAWYLGHLIRQFDGNIVLAVASYNAGPEAVGRWAEKGVGEPDEFIEAIPFNETRYFTKRVLRSYNEYLRISGENSSPRLSEVRFVP